MREKLRALTAAIVVAVTAACNATAGAQTPLQRAEKDELAFMDGEHPDMVAAMRKARATLPDFLKLASNPRRTATGFAVKVAVREGGETEYFWISDFRQKDGRFSGRIDNVPRLVKRVRQDEFISFAETDIVDWLYLEHRRMIGNFTSCALLKQERKRDAQAFMKRFGLSCDL
jgi:uncharacterized protein YegJ (DUF2314 family)